jgi:hypothetical protein
VDYNILDVKPKGKRPLERGICGWEWVDVIEVETDFEAEARFS